MRIAYFSPLGPQRSGISDYSEELLPYLGQYAEFDLFVDGYTPSNPDVTRCWPVYDYRDFETQRPLRRYDAAVYQMGNSRIHAYIYQTLCRFPGITVLHDYILHHLVIEMTAGAGDESGYIRELGYCHGTAGADYARVALYERRFNPSLRFPANRRVIDASLGVIVHSAYARSLIVAASPDVPVGVVNHHALPLRTQPAAKDSRRALGLDEGALLFASIGLATPEKRLDVALRAFRRVREHRPDAHFLIVGEVAPEYDLCSIIDDLDLTDAVSLTGYVAQDALRRYIAAIDIAVNLRWPTMGETSGSLLRLLNAGKPTMVSNVGSYAELPSNCCRKIPVGEDEEEQIFQAMLALAEDPGGRRDLGQRAQSYVQCHHSIQGSAQQYAAFIGYVLR